MDPVARRGVEGLVRRARFVGVRDERVLDALRRVDRRDFVADDFRARAFVDEPIPLPGGQTTSQPSLIARMVEALRLTGSERVLEVGTGSGYQTALLALLARRVITIDRIDALAQTAGAVLARAGLDDVVVLTGDGTLGAPEHAPFDAIVVSAAFPSVPAPLGEQLADGGRLVMPLGPGGEEVVTVLQRSGGTLVPVARLSAARFVRLYGEHGFPAE